MRKKRILIAQYTFETKNLQGPKEEFLDLTAPYIGYIVHSFNTLEELLNSELCDLFFDDYHGVGLQIIYKRTYADKVDLFRRLYYEKQNMFTKELVKYKELIERLAEAGRLRNLVVHADWESAHDDGYTLCKLKISKKGFEHEYVQFTPKSLEMILDYINEIYNIFDEYLEEKENLFGEISG